jgi:hypothetical protein
MMYQSSKKEQCDTRKDMPITMKDIVSINVMRKTRFLFAFQCPVIRFRTQQEKHHTEQKEYDR